MQAFWFLEGENDWSLSKVLLSVPGGWRVLRFIIAFVVATNLRLAHSASMAKVAIETAGCEQVAALPWRRGSDGKLLVLLVTSRTNAKWMLPKGWPMDGKADAEAALIEAREEAGIEGVVSQSPIGSYRYTKLFDDGRSMLAQAIIYPIAVTNELKNWDEKDQRSRRWVRPRKAARLAFEPDLKRFLFDLRDEATALFRF